MSAGVERSVEALLATHPEQATAIMIRFAERTGILSSGTGRRYLWTDAFAVCTFLGLARATGESRYTDLAVALVDRVHRALGRHRPDDPRVGWISGLGEDEGARHPTCGGLRIGKDLPERSPAEPFDEALEWDRDGQYFHYLTKWMHALDQTSRFTRRPELNVWARELARTAHAAFAYGPLGPGRRMAWKMSIDLKRPLVPSMGQHDPLDGLITCLQLDATARQLAAPVRPDLRYEASDFTSMLVGRDLATADPLGIGGLFADAYRLDQLRRAGAAGQDALADVLLRAASASLERHEAALRSVHARPAEQRLAFRELGLAIGLHADAKLRGGSLPSHDRLRDAIIAFWLDPENRKAKSWTEHRDINEVMLATSLLPDGFLRLDMGGPPPA